VNGSLGRRLILVYIPDRRTEQRNQRRKKKRRRKNSPLPPQRNNRPRRPTLIHLLLHLRTKRNRAHNPIPKLLIQDRLIRIPIILHNLIQAVNQRFHRRHRARSPPIGKSKQLLRELRFRHVQDLGEFLDVGGGGLCLPVEERGDCDFGTA
jgi:hypothetical protein